MAMSRKDYEMIAEVMNQSASSLMPQGIRRAVIRELVSKLSSAFMADNPRFDPEKFTRACGF